MSDERIRFFLQHIIEAADRIDEYAKGLDEVGFVKNRLVQDAVIRNLEVIGEACKNVRSQAPAFAAAHPEVPWGDAIGNRNALSHGYFTIDFALVWATIGSDIPKLRQTVANLLA